MLAFSSSNIFPTMSTTWSFEEPLSYDDHHLNTTTIITTSQSQADQTSNELFEGLIRIDNTIDFPSSHHLTTTTIITTLQSQADQTSNELVEGLICVDNSIDFPSSHDRQECLKESEFDVQRSSMEKKLSHNASERNRRKKMNFLYSTLRSLLPNPHQKKKLSFPATVSYVQEYIQELKKEIERLTKTKDLILSKKSSMNYGTNCLTTSISASQLCNGQVLIQISTTDQENDIPISQVITSLEEDDGHGLILLNASSFKSLGDKIFHSLHFQVQEPIEMDIEILKTKLLIMYEKTSKSHIV